MVYHRFRRSPIAHTCSDPPSHRIAVLLGDDPIVFVLDLDRYVYRLLQQDAIDQAEAGDTVAIEEGHYWEDIETAVRLLLCVYHTNNTVVFDFMRKCCNWW